jgi:hypothetical protein
LSAKLNDFLINNGKNGIQEKRQFENEPLINFVIALSPTGDSQLEIIGGKKVSMATRSKPITLG